MLAPSEGGKRKSLIVHASQNVVVGRGVFFSPPPEVILHSEALSSLNKLLKFSHQVSV